MSENSLPSISIDVQVMFYDTDCAAVVHNIAYLRHIETARTLLAENLGWRLTDMASAGQYPVVVRTEIDYKKPAKLGDIMRVEGWLEEVERSRFWCGFQITRAVDRALLITSRQMLALVQMPEGKVVRLPSEWRDRWGAVARRNVDSRELT
jgi:YbgC/YbaW family acyl-CoA thioester hydrolase